MPKTSDHIALTLDEATAISQQAKRGHLETDDPEVRRVVGDANRLVVRTQMWGEVPTPKHRRARKLAAIGFISAILFWVLGLMVPLLTHVGSW